MSTPQEGCKAGISEGGRVPRGAWEGVWVPGSSGWTGWSLTLPPNWLQLSLGSG